MFLLKLIRFLSGYIKILVSGRFPERFLNICAKHGIVFWYSRRKDDSIECCMFARDYRKLLRLRRGCGVKIKIKRKIGLPFFTHRYRRRQGLICGAAVFIAVMLIMPNFVWSININCDSTIDEDKVLNSLEKIGLSIGTPVSKVDTGNMRVQLALMMPEISWASINTDATSVTVDIRPTTSRDEKNEHLSNIKAGFDGRITAVYVRKGNAVLKVGDAVVAGQMLVSGTTELKDGTTSFTNSDADIIAQTFRTLDVSVPLKQKKTVDTGRVSRRQVVSAFGLTVPLYVGGIDYNYRSKAALEHLTVKGVKLPIWKAEADFIEIKSKTVTLSKTQAEKLCLKKLESLEKSKLNGKEIIERKVEYSADGNAVYAKANYVCSENISQPEYFSIDVE